MARAVRAVLVVVVLLSLGLLILLGLRIGESLSELRSEANDNLHWNLSQLEVDLVRLGEEMRVNAIQKDGSLKELRKRYDLFYSRAQNAVGGKGYSAPGLRELPQTFAALLGAYLARETPLIDGPDATLRENLPAMVDRLGTLRDSLRKVSIEMVDALAEVGDEKREALSGLIRQMTLATGATIFLLAALLAVVAWLNKVAAREQRLSDQVSRRLAATIDSALDAIIVSDDEGRIIQYSPSAERTFGYSRAEALGRDLATLIIPASLREAHAAGMARMRQTGKFKMVNNGRIQLSALHRSGREFPVELAISSAEGDQGRIMIAFLRDISDRLAAETELTSTRDKALAAGRAKTEFIAVMSHEMRTPLNGVIASLELASGMATDPELRRFIGLAQDSAQLLLRHANDVLDVTRLESGGLQLTTEDFDIEAHLSGLVETFRPICDEKRISLRYAMTGERPMLQGDPFRLGQIVRNFLSNAIKFTNIGGVTVEAEVSEQRGSSRVIEIRVTDTGPGIPYADQSRIFEDFVMLDPSFGRTGEGAGLGLSICRRLAVAMGGEIGVESTPGEGSCFWLRIPFALGRKSPTAPVTEDRAPMAAMDVLVVEDNATNRAVLGELLRRLGQQVTFAFDGEKGAAAAAAHRYDVILMDVSMPVMDGLTATRLIRKSGASKNSRIVAVTAHSMPEDLERIRASGMDDILTKPISSGNLIRVLSGTALLMAKPADGLLDDDRIAELRLALGADGLERLAVKFLGDGGDLIARLSREETLASEALSALCHEAAGLASVLGAAKLRSLCAKAEDLCRSGRAEEARHMLRHDLEPLWKETALTVKSLLQA
ncbi:ATP-binding protein [Stagnihabitans tardus]|uniref:histidine kinase n=1 Tax=Stagnihabitans tardus TaxID=2699202 RepID=A0AAE5BW45_9RHOB|nr:ATP-binding protein [Stagnihabitans tardus]NBZ89631.1 response regulator [Stagnihabitans tardus]